jgi:hypothetical protein
VHSSTIRGTPGETPRPTTPRGQESREREEEHVKTIYIEGSQSQLDDLVGQLKEDGEAQIDGEHTIVLMTIDDEDADPDSYPNARIQEQA